MRQLWDTTSHIFSQILGHTSLKFTLSLISGNWVNCGEQRGLSGNLSLLLLRLGD